MHNQPAEQLVRDLSLTDAALLILVATCLFVNTFGGASARSDGLVDDRKFQLQITQPPIAAATFEFGKPAAQRIEQ
jgi:hypothetical protein